MADGLSEKQIRFSFYNGFAKILRQHFGDKTAGSHGKTQSTSGPIPKYV